MIPQLIAFGFILSLYAVYVVRNLRDKGYTPVCDINEHISCSRAFRSMEGSMFLFHNAYWGVFYYGIWLSAYFLYPSTMPGFALLPALVSIELMYLSYVKQRNFCLVCTAIYVVNFLLAYLLWT